MSTTPSLSVPLPPVYGLSGINLPVGTLATWGARGIDDVTRVGLLGDRIAMSSLPTEEGKEGSRLLGIWLENHRSQINGAFLAAKEQGLLARNTRDVVILLEQDYMKYRYVLLAGCQSSHGYVYLTAWVLPAVLAQPVVQYPMVILPLEEKVSDRTRMALRDIQQGFQWGAKHLTEGHHFCLRKEYATWAQGGKYPANDNDSLKLTTLGERALATPKVEPKPKRRSMASLGGKVGHRGHWGAGW